jgi:hypothetical protein
MFLEKEDQKRVMMYYGKILTAAPGAQKESELIKAGAIMAIFRYLSESDTEGENPITSVHIKDTIGLDVKIILTLFLDYMQKYPELLEFPNGVQNMMTLFYPEIQYDISLLTKVVERIVENFNIIMAKDQFIQKMHDEEEEPYVEYL